MSLHDFFFVLPNKIEHVLERYALGVPVNTIMDEVKMSRKQISNILGIDVDQLDCNQINEGVNTTDERN